MVDAKSNDFPWENRSDPPAGSFHGKLEQRKELKRHPELRKDDRPSPEDIEKRDNAVTIVVFSWGLAIGCFFIPYMGFFLTPLFFMIGAVYAWSLRESWGT